MFSCCSTLTPTLTLATLINCYYLWLILLSLLPFPPVFASQQPPVKRCPSPRSLCNPNESVPEVFLDIVLNSYFADEFDTAVGGDRELVWWALAGGDEGRWWWEAENGGARMSMRSAQKQAEFHGEEEAQGQVEKRDVVVVGTTEEEFNEKEGAERMQREAAAQLEDENTEWPPNQRGFCCGEGFSCVTLTVDSGWVVCWSEELYQVLTPEKVLLNVRTLEYVYENGTVGNLRNYEVPPRQKDRSYGPTMPTPVP